MRERERDKQERDTCTQWKDIVVHRQCQRERERVETVKDMSHR